MTAWQMFWLGSALMAAARLSLNPWKEPPESLFALLFGLISFFVTFGAGAYYCFQAGKVWFP